MFTKVKKDNREEVKQEILREFFSSAEQKKAVTKAVRESAEDQKALIKKYRGLKLNKDCR
ncbi:MAG: hypothetical protein WC688_07225 [Parachlamydiales bacterium]|jgi:hypothetical protein